MLSNLGLLCSLATCCLAIKQHSVSWALPIKKQLLYSCMFMSGAGQLALHAKLCTLPHCLRSWTSKGGLGWLGRPDQCIST